MVIGVVSADGMPQEKVPRRVRVTTRNTPDVAAGDYVELKARLLPPSRAALPGGYDFARDAFFAGVGAVGSTLGPIQRLPPPGDASWRQRFDAAIDQARNRLALRVNAIIGGDEGAIAAAMVTGKRDFLSNDARDLIREAGIFHIITISGVQMTLVAGIILCRNPAAFGAVADAGASISDQELDGSLQPRQRFASAQSSYPVIYRGFPWTDAGRRWRMMVEFWRADAHMMHIWGASWGS